MLRLLLSTGLAAAASLALMPRIIVRLHRSRVMDIPNQRSSHRHPVPRGGGIGLLAPLLAGLLLAWPLGWIEHPGYALALAVGVVGLGTLGFLDDIYSLPALLRLAAQLLVAGVCLELAGFGLDRLDLPLLGGWETGGAGFLVALLWLVGFTNMFNFMDGINGMAGSQTILGAGGLALVGYLTGNDDLVLVGGLLAGGAVGFLRWNFPKARVFLGDVGSLPVGFALALSVLFARAGAATGGWSAPGPDGGTATGLPVWIPVLLVWPFLFDAGYTLVNRAVHGRNPIRPHRSHVYQRLVVAGASHQRVTMMYAGWMLACTAVALVSLSRPAAGGRLFWVVVVASLAWTLRTVTRIRASMTTPSEPL